MLSPGLEIARTGPDVRRLDGKRATAVGTYRAIERPVKGVAIGNATKDRAVLELDDGTRLYLEPLDSSTSLRSADERQRFEGQKVRVRGVLHFRMPSQGQSLIAPCIAEIEDVVEQHVKP